MIGIILDILSMDPFYGVSEEIDIAKGRDKLPMGIREGLEKQKRKRKWGKR